MSKYLLTSETTSLELPKQYPIALLLVGGIGLLQQLSTLHYIKKRREIYGRLKFMDNFQEDHDIAYDGKSLLHPHGDPDNVDGWYSQKLSYKEWYSLACAKRAH